MGTSHGDFFKYPRTPHLVGSTGTSDDKRLGADDSNRLLANPSLIIEEKLDGTNVGLHFSDGRLILQCRGHEITSGMHPQYDLFKQWATVKHNVFLRMLEERYIVYGEWMYAKHCIQYSKLPHYFFEFDILDKTTKTFLTLDQRLELLEGTGIETVPVVHRGLITETELTDLIVPSRFGATFEHPQTGSCRQDPQWHAEGDVWTHTKMVLDEIVLVDGYSNLDRIQQIILILTAIFHDSGKPETTMVEEATGRIRSPKHAARGARIARRVLMDPGCPFETREHICHLVLFHGRPPYLGKNRTAENDVIRVSHYLSNHLLFMFAVADTRGRICTSEKANPEENLYLWKFQAAESECLEQPFAFKHDCSTTADNWIIFTTLLMKTTDAA